MQKKGDVLDAQRLSDGKFVFLKNVLKDSPEVEISRYLQSNGLDKDPHNHAAPVLEYLQNPDEPDHFILVFPLLRSVNSPGFLSVREALDYISQTLEVRCNFS